MNFKKILLGTAAFFASSFVVQGILGFIVAGDYFLSIPAMREEPLFALSLSHTVISGIGFAILYSLTTLVGTPVMRGLKYGLLVSLIVVSFVALDIPGRFTIPTVNTWIIVQGVLGILHFGLSGLLVGLIYGQEKAIA